MKRTMINKKNRMVLISKEDVYRLIKFIARIDQSVYEFDIINKSDFDPGIHRIASLDMLENCFENPEQLISMLTDDAMTIFKVTPKKGSEVMDELGRAIEFFSMGINDGTNDSDGIKEYVNILILLRDTINQNIEQ